MDVACTATWRQGEWRVTVSSPEHGEWAYGVIGDRDRPSRAWFIGTPWAIYPGADWEEQDGTGVAPPVWAVRVFLERPEVIRKLTDRAGFASSK